MIPKYNEDFYGWAMSTANLLRERKMDELDFDSLIDEIEDMGKSERRELESRLAQLIFHLLKWQYQPTHRGSSWEASIEDQRIQIDSLLKHSPSLRKKLFECIHISFRRAKLFMKKETPVDIKLLPLECPYILSELRDEKFYPESDHVIKRELYAGSGLKD